MRLCGACVMPGMRSKDPGVRATSHAGVPMGVWLGVCVGVGVYGYGPGGRGACRGRVTCGAAACYSPTSCRVQYHRRARS